MKASLIILISIFGLLNKVHAQSASTAIDSLIKFKIITPTDRPFIEDALNHKYGFSDNTIILKSLKDIKLQKVFHTTFNQKRPAFYSYTYKFDTTKKESIKKALHLEVEEIQRSGLLTKRVYTKTVNFIDSCQYSVELQMVADIARMSLNYEMLTADKLLPIAEQLNKNDIMSDSSLARFKSDVINEKIESAFQLNNYLRFDRTIDLTKYPADTDIWLKQLHTDIASILPGLNFTDFSYTTQPDNKFTIRNIPGIKFKISLTCNGRKYGYSITTFGLSHKKGNFLYADIGMKSFYRIFNKILTDQQSPYRLHELMFNRATKENILSHFAIIALRDEQTRAFMPESVMSYMMISMESYDSTLTSARIDNVIAGWKKMGLFTHLTEAELDKAVDDALADDWFFKDKLLENFPHVVTAVFSGSVIPNNPCVAFLKKLADITHGAFNPQKIAQKKVKGGIILQYYSNGKMHSQLFRSEYLWLDPQFAKFLKQLPVENNLKGSFYSLPYSEDVIYLTKQQYSYAIAHKLLDLSPMPN